MVHASFGNCGTLPSPALLLISGEADRCPIADVAENPWLAELASCCHTPEHDPLAGVAGLLLPPVVRAARVLSASWLKEWEAAHG